MLCSVIDVVMDGLIDGTVDAELFVQISSNYNNEADQNRLVDCVTQLPLCQQREREKRREEHDRSRDTRRGMEIERKACFNALCVQNEPYCLSMKWSC